MFLERLPTLLPDLAKNFFDYGAESLTHLNHVHNAGFQDNNEAHRLLWIPATRIRSS